MRATIPFLPAVTALALLAAGACVTDAKGESCGFLDSYVDPSEDEDGDDEVYCPDPDAEADCDAMTDAILAAAVTCSGGAINEDDLRADLEADGALLACEDAVATDVSYDECLDALADPPCTPQGTLGEMPPSCVGAVLIDG